MKILLVLLAIPALLLGADEKKKAPRAIAEITLRVIEASSAANAGNDAADLVPAELKTLLKFTRYRLMDSAYVKGVEDESMRVFLAGKLSGRIRFDVRARLPVPLLEFEVQIDGPAATGERAPRLLETTTTAKSGETVVLGASRMLDSTNALIVVLTGKLLPE